MAEFFSGRNVLVDKAGAARTIDPNTLVLVYFSAHWCPPCRLFTPELKAFYENVREEGLALEIVFVSGDKSEEEMKAYFTGHHGDWLALKYSEEAVKGQLHGACGVRGIPALHVLNAQGTSVAGNDTKSQVANAARGGEAACAKVVNQWRAVAGLPATPVVELPGELSVTLHHRGGVKDLVIEPQDGLEMLQMQIFSYTEIEDTQQKILIGGRVILTDDDFVSSLQRCLRTGSAIEVLVLARMSRHDRLPAFPPSVTQELKQQQIGLLSFKVQRLHSQLEGPVKQMLDEAFRHWTHVQVYEDPQMQMKALRKIPLLRLHKAALEMTEEDPRYEFRLMKQLLMWFKNEFFKWVNAPKCSKCGNATKQLGGTQPTPEERQDGANVTELYQCNVCQSMERFPRFNNPARLLEEQRGRCGEWANCFSLIARACGYPTRWVHDVTDHVWCEVWMDDSATSGPGEGRWLHADACENRLDAPKLYEAGWGKKLSYVFGYAHDHMADVARKYAKEWPDMLSRRNRAPEAAIESMVNKVNVVFIDEVADMMEPADGSRYRKLTEARLASEKVELDAFGSAVSASEAVGRTTGDETWRRARGELGADAAAVTAAVKEIEGGEAAVAQPAAEVKVEATVTQQETPDSAKSGKTDSVKPETADVDRQQAELKKRIISASKRIYEELVGAGVPKAEAAAKAVEQAKREVSACV